MLSSAISYTSGKDVFLMRDGGQQEEGRGCVGVTGWRRASEDESMDCSGTSTKEQRDEAGVCGWWRWGEGGGSGVVGAGWDEPGPPAAAV